MRRWAALVMVGACASSPAVHSQSVVTVRETQHVVMAISALPCSKQCRELDCVLRCPTARLRGGSCGLDDNKGELHCRNFVHFRTFEREGRCADGEVAGIERVSCTDQAAATTNNDSNTAKSIFAGLLLLPLLFIYIVATAGNRT
jgi:hypothetical protein